MDKSFYEVLAKQAGDTADRMETLEDGSDKRKSEAEILDMLQKALVNAEENDVRAYIEQERLKFEQEKLKSESKRDWAKIIISGASVAAGTVLGIFGFKYNIEAGNLVGKDGLKWTDWMFKKH